MNVTVSDASGKGAFTGTTNADGTFTTERLKPGNYIVQLKSRRASMSAPSYAVVVSAGRKKVIAIGVPQEKLAAGGVAMKVDVTIPSRITGQVVNGQSVASTQDPNVKVINGHRFAWIMPLTGSNLGAHWEEVGIAPGQNVGYLSTDKLRQIQDRGDEGSMLDRFHNHHHGVGE